MKEFIKKYYKQLLLVLIYLALGNVVYIILANEMWHLWFVDIIVGVVITAFGVYLGYLYLRSEIKAEEKKKEESIKLEAEE